MYLLLHVFKVAGKVVVVVVHEAAIAEVQVVLQEHVLDELFLGFEVRVVELLPLGFEDQNAVNLAGVRVLNVVLLSAVGFGRFPLQNEEIGRVVPVGGANYECLEAPFRYPL